MKMNKTLNNQLDDFIIRLKWILERKDFNSFWPIGIPVAGINGAEDLIITMHEMLATAANDNSFIYENPTSLLLVYLYSIYGLREMGWQKDDRLNFASNIFKIILRSKKTDLTNSCGKYILSDKFIPYKIDEIPWINVSDKKLSKLVHLVNQLGGLLWAFGEAAYYYNHRIATERHGPYESPFNNSMVLIRSAYNLNPTEIWSSKILPALQHKAIYIYGNYKFSSVEFDLFSNPIFQFDINKQINKMAVIVVEHDGKIHINPDEIFLNEIIYSLTLAINKLVGITNSMSSEDLINQVFKIMLYACNPIIKTFNFNKKNYKNYVAYNTLKKTIRKTGGVLGDINYLLKYYDIRQEVLK